MRSFRKKSEKTEKNIRWKKHMGIKKSIQSWENRRAQGYLIHWGWIFIMRRILCQCRFYHKGRYYASSPDIKGVGKEGGFPVKFLLRTTRVSASPKLTAFSAQSDRENLCWRSMSLPSGWRKRLWTAWSGCLRTEVWQKASEDIWWGQDSKKFIIHKRSYQSV